MEPVDSESLRRILDKAGLTTAELAIGIGAQLSFTHTPARTIVVQLGDAADRRSRLTSAVLSIADGWLLTPRHGSVAQLRLLNDPPDATAAISFAASEHAELGAYLCGRSMDLGEASADLYCVAASGDVLVTWDHHTEDEGLTIELRRVEDASQMLVSLNEVGADLEVFCAPG